MGAVGRIDRVRAHRLRSVQFWVPDVRSADFVTEARRQSLLVANSPHKAEDQAFVDAVDWGSLRNDE